MTCTLYVYDVQSNAEVYQRTTARVPVVVAVPAKVNLFGLKMSHVDLKSEERSLAMDTNVGDQGDGDTEVDAFGFSSRWFGFVGGRTKPEVDKIDVRYSMNHGKRGRAIIFNHEIFHKNVKKNRRVGTQIDAQKLSERFQELGFEVQLHQDLKATEMKEEIFEASVSDHSDCDAFVCVFLSHGDEGKVYAHDRVVHLQELIDQFRADVCKTLAGKPKLFFIEASRGDRYERDVSAPDVPDTVDGFQPMTEVDSDARATIPAGADFFIAYSATEDHNSYLDKEEGSWFVQALSHVLEKYGTEIEINEIMAIVNRMVSEKQLDDDMTHDPEMVDKKQMPCYVSMLTKKLYFPK
ncbi:caspase-6-like isoform X2 [Ptychodera flava]|uniref:caspase-6-like isoform X2 n=1 Tax=Ptychodera flava TaxID=63121 RepID=UPI00396A8138